MFRNSGVGRTSNRMPDNVTIPRLKIGGAFELSPSGIEKLNRLRIDVAREGTLMLVGTESLAESQMPR